MLECGAQATGGYFADPGYTDVPDSWKIGFPIAEVHEDGDVIITKVEESGGIVSRSTCTEQLLYEIHDPSNYVTPDGIADFSNVTIEELLVNKVRVRGARARKKPESLKVSIGYKTYIVEAEISYGGSGCLARAEMASEIVRKRLDYVKAPYEELRIDFIGVNSLYGDSISRKIQPNPGAVSEVRLRLAARAHELETAKQIGREFETLYTNGPAGGGGVRQYANEVVSISSILIPREEVKTEVKYEVS